MPLVLAAVAEVAVEIPYDGIDQDGDGRDLTDRDGDGANSELVGGPDCNDRDPRVGPHAWDWPGDGVDSDCDGSDRGAHGPTPQALVGAGVGALVLLLAVWMLVSRRLRTLREADA